MTRTNDEQARIERLEKALRDECDRQLGFFAETTQKLYPGAEKYAYAYEVLRDLCHRASLEEKP
jgi:hypothetical protein